MDNLNYTFIDIADLSKEEIESNGILALTPMVYIDRNKIEQDTVTQAGWIKIRSTLIPAFAGGVLNNVREILDASISIQETAHDPEDFSFAL